MSLTCVYHDCAVALDLFVFSCSIQCLHGSIHILIIAHSISANLSILIVSLSVKQGEDDGSLLKPKNTHQSIEFTSILQSHTALAWVSQGSSREKYLSISVLFAVKKE